MLRHVLILAFVSSFLAPAVHADLHWHRVAQVDDVAIQVKRLVPSELRAVHEKYGQEGRHEGLAVLFRMTDGTYRCEIYIAADTAVATLDHEKRHCRGWVH